MSLSGIILLLPDELPLLLNLNLFVCLFAELAWLLFAWEMLFTLLLFLK